MPARKLGRTHRLDELALQDGKTWRMWPPLGLQHHAPQGTAIRTASPANWQARKLKGTPPRSQAGFLWWAASRAKTFRARHARFAANRAMRGKQIIPCSCPCFHPWKTGSAPIGDRIFVLTSHAVAAATARGSRNADGFTHRTHEGLEGLALLGLDVEQLANLARQTDVVFKGKVLRL